MKNFDDISITQVSFSSPKKATDESYYQTRQGKSAESKGYYQREVLSRVTSSKHTGLIVTPEKGAVDDINNVIPLSADSLNRSMKTNKRKAAARRNLMGSIYTKHNDVKRSYSFVAGEHTQVEIRFPKVYFSENSNRNQSQQYICDQTSYSRDSRRTSVPQSYPDSPVSSIKSIEKKYSSPRRASLSHKLNLPEIIMEFNVEANNSTDGKHERNIKPSDSDGDERVFGAPYEELLNRPRNIMNNPCRARHRPLTPGLLESLNKSKLPSKVKTEQWITASLSSNKSYCAESYKNGNLDSVNLAIPNWIYTDS